MAQSRGRIAIFVGDDYEDLELWYPKLRVEAAGFRTVLAGLDADKHYSGKHGYPARSEARVADLKAADLAALIIPGGWMPDKLRRDEAVLELTRAVSKAGKPIAAICHGPWILASAGLCRGVRMTGSRGIRDDMVNAGAEWVDAEVVTDHGIITSRTPVDLPAFGEALVKAL